MAESKHEKFQRLSQARLEKVGFALKQLTYLNSHNYEFSLEEATAIVVQLEEWVNQVAQSLGVETVPEPESAPTATRGVSWGEGPLELTTQEGQYLIRVGAQLGAAIEAISDNQAEYAQGLLLNLMRS